MTDPSGVMSDAWLVTLPGVEPRPTIPLAASHRNASPAGPAALWLEPTTKKPALDAALAKEMSLLPGRSPRSTIPVAGVHRKAW